MAPTLRTFRGSDSTAALAAAKAELGPEAVVFGTREISGGLLRRSEFEVTAALLDQVQASPVAPPQATPPPRAPLPVNPWNDELRELREAVNETKKALLAVTNEARTGEELQIPPAAARLVARLVERGVEDLLAEELVRQALAEGTSPREATLLEAIQALLVRRMRVGPTPWTPPQRAGRRVLALIGPTGVGKTTSLAKIAARAILEAKRQVALITVDTYRIGACDQIGEYGQIMKVPTFEANNARELAQALETCTRADLVLVDTGGRSNQKEVLSQAQMLRTIPGIELCLVFSAAVGPLQTAAIANSYRTLLPESLLVTKLDEAVAPGALLSATTRIRQPLIALADGQRIPEDIHPATEARLSSLLLGDVTARPERELEVAMADQAETLRKALKHGVPQPLRVVAVTSGKGGVGKTHVSANLALLAAKSGKRVLVIDADLALANVEILYGLNPRYDLRHLLSHEASLEQVLAQGPHGVRVLSAGTGIEAISDLTDAQKLELVSSLDSLENMFDVIFVDTGAGIGDNVRFFAGAAQEAVLVITPEPTSLTDAYTALKVFSLQAGVDNFHVVVNQVTSERQARETFDRLAGVAQRFLKAHISYLGHIPRDEMVARALMVRKPLVDLFPTSPATYALEILHKRLLGTPPRPSNNGGLKFLWNRLLRELTAAAV